MPDDFVHPLWLPFTREEFVRAYRLTLTPERARELVDKLSADVETLDRLINEPGAFDASAANAASGIALAGMSLSLDTLVILSLMTQELAERVSAHLGRALGDARFQHYWNARRDELAPDVRTFLNLA